MNFKQYIFFFIFIVPSLGMIPVSLEFNFMNAQGYVTYKINVAKADLIPDTTTAPISDRNKTVKIKTNECGAIETGATVPEEQATAATASGANAAVLTTPVWGQPVPLNPFDPTVLKDALATLGLNSLYIWEEGDDQSTREFNSAYDIIEVDTATEEGVVSIRFSADAVQLMFQYNSEPATRHTVICLMSVEPLDRSKKQFPKNGGNVATILKSNFPIKDIKGQDLPSAFDAPGMIATLSVASKKGRKAVIFRMTDENEKLKKIGVYIFSLVEDHRSPITQDETDSSLFFWSQEPDLTAKPLWKNFLKLLEGKPSAGAPEEVYEEQPPLCLNNVMGKLNS